MVGKLILVVSDDERWRDRLIIFEHMLVSKVGPAQNVVDHVLKKACNFFVYIIQKEKLLEKL